MFSKEKIRYQLYRFQQRLAITRREALTIWVVFALIFLGVVVKEYRKRTFSFDPALYADSDSLFAAAVEAMRREEIPRDTSAGKTDSTAIAEPLEPININTALQPELERLPRIGPAMSRRIIDYRTRYGRFRRPEDLMQVRGIGPKTYEQLEPMIVVE